MSKLQSQRDKLVSDLVAIIGDPKYDEDEWTNPNSPRNFAIRSLGLVRAARASGVLVMHLIPKKGQVTGLGDELRHPPASEALIRIGSPAFPEILAEVSKNGNPDLRRECARILIQSVGGSAGRAIVQDRIRQSAASARANLEALMKYLPLPASSSAEDADTLGRIGNEDYVPNRANEPLPKLSGLDHRIAAQSEYVRGQEDKRADPQKAQLRSNEWPSVPAKSVQTPQEKMGVSLMVVLASALAGMALGAGLASLLVSRRKAS